MKTAWADEALKEKEAGKGIPGEGKAGYGRGGDGRLGEGKSGEWSPGGKAPVTEVSGKGIHEGTELAPGNSADGRSGEEFAESARAGEQERKKSPFFSRFRGKDMSEGARQQEQRLLWIPVKLIHPNPYQPRRDFDGDKLEKLAESIRENGIIQPLTVRKVKDGYELIAGERRLRGAKAAGLETVPCVLGRYTDEQSSVLALVENIQRSELNFFEEADAIGRLMVCHEMTQEEIAKRLGKSQPAVANKLRLLRLPDDIRRRILENGLTERHARSLLRLPDEKTVKKALDAIIAGKLNVAETDRMVEKLLEGGAKKRRRKVAVIRDLRLFRNTLDRAVKSIKSTGVSVETRVEEKDDHIEYVISLPKSVEN